MDKHLFVLCGDGQLQGWWLKLTNAEELAEYHAEHNGRYGRAFQNILDERNAGSEGILHGKNAAEMPLTYAIYYHALNRRISPIEACIEISGSVANAQLEALKSQGFIYVNRMGGWCWKPMGTIRQTFLKEGFSFPDFGKDDIRISRWPGGQHYYAHIGSMEVRDGDTIKWDSYQEAYEKALACIGTT